MSSPDTSPALRPPDTRRTIFALASAAVISVVVLVLLAIFDVK